MSQKFGVTPVAYFSFRRESEKPVTPCDRFSKIDPNFSLRRNPETVQSLEAFLAHFKAIGDGPDR